MFDNLPGSVEHIKAGTLRALGVTAGKRAAAIPDVPTIGETVPGYEAVVWYGIVAPKGTPPEAVNVLNAAGTPSSPIRSSRRGSRNSAARRCR